MEGAGGWCSWGAPHALVGTDASVVATAFHADVQCRARQWPARPALLLPGCHLQGQAVQHRREGDVQQARVLQRLGHRAAQQAEVGDLQSGGASGDGARR